MTQEERYKRFEEYLKATPAERRKFDMSFLNDYPEDEEHLRDTTKMMQPSKNIPPRRR